MSGWQAIVTAPRDGTPIMLQIKNDPSHSRPPGMPDMVVGKWQGALLSGRWVSDIAVAASGSSGEPWCEPDEIDPVRWQALPDL